MFGSAKFLFGRNTCHRLTNCSVCHIQRPNCMLQNDMSNNVMMTAPINSRLNVVLPSPTPFGLELGQYFFLVVVFEKMHCASSTGNSEAGLNTSSSSKAADFPATPKWRAFNNKVRNFDDVALDGEASLLSLRQYVSFPALKRERVNCLVRENEFGNWR